MGGCWSRGPRLRRGCGCSLRDLLDRAEEAIHETQRTAAGLAGPVRLGFVIGAAGTVLPDIVRTFRTRHPRVELDLSHTSVAHGIQALQERRLDVALVRMPSPAAAADLVIDTLIPDPLVAAIPAPGDTDNQPVSTSTLHLAELLNRPFVFWPRAMAPSLHDHIFQHCRTVTGQAPSVIIETSNTLALLALVAADVGVTLVTSGTAESLSRQAVAYRHLDDPPQATLAVVHYANPTPATRALIAVCHEFAARRRRDQKSIDLDTDR